MAASVSNWTIEKEEVAKIGRLENGQVYLMKVFDRQQSWVVEMRDLTMRSLAMRHSYVFPRTFEIDQVLTEAADMYNDLVLQRDENLCS